MTSQRYTQFVLTAIALLLAVIAFRPLMVPVPALAQNDTPDFYIEPGYTPLRKPDGTAQLLGKVMIDRRTGDVWGFPTLVERAYPVNTAGVEPPVSEPMYLGRFKLEAARRR